MTRLIILARHYISERGKCRHQRVEVVAMDKFRTASAEQARSLRTVLSALNGRDKTWALRTGLVHEYVSNNGQNKA